MDEVAEEEGAGGDRGLEAEGEVVPDGVGAGWWGMGGGGQEVVVDLEAEFGGEGGEGGHGLVGGCDGGRLWGRFMWGVWWGGRCEGSPGFMYGVCSPRLAGWTLRKRVNDCPRQGSWGSELRHLTSALSGEMRCVYFDGHILFISIYSPPILTVYYCTIHVYGISTIH